MKVGLPAWVFALLLALLLHGAVFKIWPIGSQPATDNDTGLEVRVSLQSAEQTPNTVVPAAKPKPSSKSQPEPKPEPKPEPRPEPKSQSGPEPQTNPEPKSESGPEPKPEPKTIPEPKPDLSAGQVRAPDTDSAQHNEKESLNAALQSVETASLERRKLSSAYEANLIAWIERYKRYPRLAMRRKQEGLVNISFTINRLGKLLSSKIERSSGRALLDKAAMETLTKSSPMPPVPDDMKGERFSYTLPIRFALE